MNTQNTLNFILKTKPTGATILTINAQDLYNALYDADNSVDPYKAYQKWLSRTLEKYAEFYFNNQDYLRIKEPNPSTGRKCYEYYIGIEMAIHLATYAKHSRNSISVVNQLKQAQATNARPTTHAEQPTASVPQPITHDWNKHMIQELKTAIQRHEQQLQHYQAQIVYQQDTLTQLQNKWHTEKQMHDKAQELLRYYQHP